MLNFLRKLFSSIQGSKSVIDYKGYKNKFTNYMNMVEGCSKNEDRVRTAQNLLMVVVEYLNFDEAIQAVETNHEAQDNSLIEEIYNEIVYEIDLTINEIICRSIHSDDAKYYKNKTIREQGPIEIMVKELPILLNPWNSNRIISNLDTINNQNPFDGDRYSYNIENHYVYPMDIAICNGANHSQFAARMINKGNTVIKEVRDYSVLYDHVYFDGKDYRNKEGHLIISLDYNKKVIFYSGVIFELGRFLLDADYHRFEETRKTALGL
jgi:hypothetical protein